MNAKDKKLKKMFEEKGKKEVDRNPDTVIDGKKKIKK